MTVKAAKPKNHQIQSPEKKPPETTAVVVTAPSRPLTSDNALDRHLAEWSSGGLRLIAFNGSTGIHRTLDDKVEVADGTQFVALLNQTRKGYIKFNSGAPPSICMVGIEEEAELPERDTLGDNDKTKWPLDMNGQQTDPWKPQIAFPMSRYDAGAALFLYVARGPVAMNSVSGLLGEFRYHPKRLAGLLPVIKVKNGTYWSKKHNCNRPKPVYEIALWVTKTGEVPPSAEVTKAIEQALPFNDEIGI
jgi:hypothetical protein